MKAFVALGLSLALVATVEAGPRGGPVSESDKEIRPGSTTTYKMICNARQDTAVEITGNGSSDLDVLVLDNRGKVITGAYGAGDHAKVNWYSPHEERVWILILNRGPVANTYTFSAR